MNNDVSKIQLGLGQVNSQAPKTEQKAEEKVAEVKTVAYEDKSSQILDSLDLTAKYNAASLGFKQVEPSRYLTPERMADIEASMTVFNKGVKAHLSALNGEFGHLSEFSSLSEAEKLEMAAKSFSHNG